MEHILVSNILAHLDLHKILVDCQHGFRARRSCETQLLTLVHELTTGLDNGKRFDLAILDFSKAFDRVPHKRLLHKLDHSGIRGPALSWIRSFLSEQTQRVVVDGAMSEEGQVVSGVPQGSVLGPLLFLVFINDLPSCVKSKVRPFADDCIVYREVKHKKNTKIFQKDLGNLEKWEKKWGMDFHPDKCNILHVTKKKEVINVRHHLKGHILKTVQSVKYLGLDIHHQLNWDGYIEKNCTKG